MSVKVHKTHTILEMGLVNGHDDDDEDADALTNAYLSKNCKTWNGKGLFSLFSTTPSRRKLMSSVKQKKDVQKWQQQNKQRPKLQDFQQQNSNIFKQKQQEDSKNKLTCVKIINPADLNNAKAIFLKDVQRLEIEDSEAILTEISNHLLSLLTPPKLSYLSIRWSAIKHIPSDVFHSGLEYLILADNQIKTISGLERSEKSLKVLNLQNNHLNQLPRELCYMNRIVELNISRNNLIEIIESIGSLCSLEIFDCSFNKLKTLPNSICELKNLKRLIISSNMIFSLESALSRLANLEDLQANHNQLSSLPFSFESLKNLKSILLGKNNFRNIPTCLCNLSELSTVNLKQNRIQFASSPLLYVKTLVLDDNQLTEVPKLLLQSTSIEHLWLRNNQLGSIPLEISTLTHLRTLHLDGNIFLNRLPISITTIINLKRVSVKNTKVDRNSETVSNLLDRNVTVESGQDDGAVIIPKSAAFGRHTVGTKILINPRESIVPDKNVNLSYCNNESKSNTQIKNETNKIPVNKHYETEKDYKYKQRHGINNL